MARNNAEKTGILLSRAENRRSHALRGQTALKTMELTLRAVRKHFWRLFFDSFRQSFFPLF